MNETVKVVSMAQGPNKQSIQDLLAYINHQLEAIEHMVSYKVDEASLKKFQQYDEQFRNIGKALIVNSSQACTK